MWLSLWHYKTGLYENSMNISELLVSPPRGENCILSTMLFNFLIKKMYQLQMENNWKYDERYHKSAKVYYSWWQASTHIYIYIYMKCLHFFYFIISSTETESKGIIKYVNRIYLMIIIWLFTTIYKHIHDNYVLHNFTNRVI